MLANLKLQDWGIILTVIISIGGLVYNVGEIVNINSQQTEDIKRHDRQIEQLDRDQRQDHDAIVGIQSDLDYLVNREKKRETRR